MEGTCNSATPAREAAAPPGFEVTLEGMGSQPGDQGLELLQGCNSFPATEWKRGARGETGRATPVTLSQIARKDRRERHGVPVNVAHDAGQGRQTTDRQRDEEMLVLRSRVFLTQIVF